MDHLPNGKRIYLIGMMGSGKSHWAGRLARRFGVRAFDLDKLIEEASNMTIPEIFKEEGEEPFRKIETGMLQTGIPSNEFVLACGGGTPCFHDNMDFMKQSGVVIWLNPSVEELIKRLMKGKDSRPLLASLQTEDELRTYLLKLADQRNQWYKQAHITINQDFFNINEAVSKIQSAFPEFI